MVNRLFIFGNGFDIAHRTDNQLKTKYSDFRKWLISKCNNFIKDKYYDFELPAYETNYRRLESYDESEFAEFFVRLIDEACEEDVDWNTFEDALGSLDWSLVLQNVEDVYDADGDLNYYKSETNHSILAQNCGESNHILKDFFKEWILDINSDFSEVKRKQIFEMLNFSSNDKFLVFNYTSTLEKLYGIQNVFHIHGDASKYQELIVGHGYEYYEEINNDPLNDEAYQVFEAIFNHYKKDTHTILDKNRSFFDSLSDIDALYIYGFSFGNVDDYYFEFLFKNYNFKDLFLYVYEDDKYKEFLSKVRSLGFRGNIINWKKSVNY